jgi:hypothetical protein
VKGSFRLRNAKRAHDIESKGICIASKNVNGGYRLARENLVSIITKLGWVLDNDRKLGLRRERLLEKLSDYDYMSSFKQARKKRHWTTSSWLLDTDDYQNWLAGNLSLFWCSGLREYPMLKLPLP